MCCCNAYGYVTCSSFLMFRTPVLALFAWSCFLFCLYQVLAGLWPAESGTVIAPSTNVMWLPQRPYLVLGNLRDQVTYPLQFQDNEEDALAMGGTGRVISKEEDEKIVQCTCSTYFVVVSLHSSHVSDLVFVALRLLLLCIFASLHLCVFASLRLCFFDLHRFEIGWVGSFCRSR